MKYNFVKSCRVLQGLFSALIYLNNCTNFTCYKESITREFYSDSHVHRKFNIMLFEIP